MKRLGLALHFAGCLALLSLAACSHTGTNKLSKIEHDKGHIKDFAGCYKVDFKFAETFPLEKGYKTTKPYQTGGIEVVIVDEETPTTVGLQHILIVGDEKNNAALKHWRQDWTFEPTEILDFKGNNTWAMRKLTPKESEGQWLQSVTQVDDSPRYECVAPWAKTGTGPAWECKSWNPLPRREYTKRKDYQVIERDNAQKLTSYGWIHEQDSQKIKLEGDKATAFVKERGENTYTRIPDDKCKMAVDWWTTHKDNWKSIRKSWSQIRAENPLLKLNFKDQEGDLWKKLFELDDKAVTEKWDQNRMGQEAKAAIQSYIVK